MIKKLTLFLLGLILTGGFAEAQQTCGFDAYHQQMAASNPAYAQRINKFNAKWARMSQDGPTSLIVNTSQGPVYEIPVVIHVIHTGGAVGSIYNPSDANLNGMINYLNASYAATWAAYPDSLSGGTHFPVRFALAKRNGCVASTGINRVNGSSLAGYTANGVNRNNSTGASDAQVKALSAWDNNDYYNVWVVNKIDGKDGTAGTFIAGYATFPGAGPGVDGTVMLATQAIAGEITLPHEIGHAFSLYHTFQGGDVASCPTEFSCATENDMVCDTEPQRQSNFNCPNDPNPCTGNSYNFVQHNFMDYSSCQDRFTKGQRTRWIASMLNDRGSLISSLGATAPTTPGVTAAICMPTITIPTNNSNAGVYEVKFNDMVGTSAGGYNSDGNRVYIDRSCTQRANVLSGQSYPLSVQTGPNPERVRVYIDYNNDGIFGTTAPELVYSHDGTQFNELHSTNITIPSTGVVTCVPLRMRVVSDRITAGVPAPCAALSYGQAEDYSVSVTGPSNTASVSIALTAGTNPSCINSPLTFTATPGGTATSPTYKWYINGVAVTGATATTLTTSAPANGSVITARIFYTGPCGLDSSVSNSITIQRNTSVVPTVNVALTSGSNPGCPGQALTFTATSTNEGTTPTYLWQIYDGTSYANATGATGNTYSTSTLPCNYGVRVILTSGLSCASPASVTSNTVTYTCGAVSSTATIAQTGGSNPTCAGKPVTFTATVTNPGTAPTYSWLINGVPAGVSTTTFTTNTLNDNDTVQFLMVTSNPCVPSPNILSNQIAVTVIPVDTPQVFVTVSQGSNPGCVDSVLGFTASATVSTGASAFTWYKNGMQAAIGTTTYTTGFVNGDKIYVSVVAGPGCHYTDTTYSDTVTVVRVSRPAAPVISFIGNFLVSSVTPVQWYGPSGLIPGATGQSYHPTAAGNHYARATGTGCPSDPSNMLQVSLLTIGNYNLSNVNIFPNPTSGLVTFDWGTTPANTKLTVYNVTGQVLMQQFAGNVTRKTLDLTAFSAGNYFIVLQDEQGKAGTVRITLAK